MRTYSWPRMLKYLKYKSDSKENDKGKSICHSCKYSILVRGDQKVFGENLRTYVWAGGTYAADLKLEDNITPDPKAGTDWCFAYGEKEWVSGKKWENIQKLGDKYNIGVKDIGTTDPRIACPSI